MIQPRDSLLIMVVEDMAEERAEVVDAAVVTVDKEVDTTRIVGVDSRAITTGG